MTLKCSETRLSGVLLIEPRAFEDDRGFFMETYHLDKYTKLGIRGSFVQDNMSHSKQYTLRGLHYQLEHPQGKLVYTVRGRIFDIAVDIRKGSPTFGQWVSTILSSNNHRQLYVPGGFAHGFCVLSQTADVIYKCTDLYAPGDEYGIIWSDPALGIEWPVDSPVLSKKDAANPQLKEVPKNLLPIYER